MLLLAGCGGDIARLGADLDAGNPPERDAIIVSHPDTSPPPDASFVVDSAVGMDAQVCIDLIVTPADLACTTDDDCMLGVAGMLCSIPCGCNSTALNQTAAATFASEISSSNLPPPNGCPGGCPDFGQPRCLGSQCVLCGFGGNNPPGCNEDAGEPDVVTTSDAGRCVIVEPTMFDQSCESAADCIPIASGKVCDGECDCDQTAAISVTDEVSYQQAIQGITFSECHCLSASAICVSGQCATCPAGEPCPE
jgi:hypothetical protein